MELTRELAQEKDSAKRDSLMKEFKRLSKEFEDENKKQFKKIIRTETFFEKIPMPNFLRNRLDKLAGSPSKSKTFMGAILEQGTKIKNKRLESELSGLLENPSKISSYFKHNIQDLCTLFNCKNKVADLPEAIKINLKNNFIATGFELTPRVKSLFKEIFTKYMKDVEIAISEEIQQYAQQDIKKTSAENLPGLVQAKLYKFKGKQRIKELIKLYCQILDPAKFNKDYTDIEFHFYRALKSELRKYVNQKIKYIQGLQLNNPVWKKIKPKLLEKMELDSHLD